MRPFGPFGSIPLGRIACILALASMALPAMAQVYKWVDQDGRVHFGDNPPRGVKADAVPIRPGPPSPAPASGAPPVESPAAAPATPAAGAAPAASPPPAPAQPAAPPPPRNAAEAAKERERFEQAVKERRILIGMAADHVRRALGQPTGQEVRRLPGGAVETWIYAIPAGAETITGVEFTDGRVSKFATGAGPSPVTQASDKPAAKDAAPADREADDKAAERAIQRCTAFRNTQRRLEDEQRRGVAASRAAEIASERRYVARQLQDMRCPP